MIYSARSRPKSRITWRSIVCVHWRLTQSTAPAHDLVRSLVEQQLIRCFKSPPLSATHERPSGGQLDSRRGERFYYLHVFMRVHLKLSLSFKDLHLCPRLIKNALLAKYEK
jgi:hypothetical protein